jgi:hypothetical protein
MRLFLSPSVKVYYLYFKGSKQQRGWHEMLFLTKGEAGNRRCRCRERGRRSPLFTAKGAKP